MEAVKKAFWLDYAAWQRKQKIANRRKRAAVNHPDLENFDKDLGLDLDTYLQETLVKQYGNTLI